MTLLLNFASQKLGKTPTALQLVDIQPDLILAFPSHLEQGRHNAIRSRNLRLSALRTFLITPLRKYDLHRESSGIPDVLAVEETLDHMGLPLAAVQV